jgi:hypothetical protein
VTDLNRKVAELGEHAEPDDDTEPDQDDTEATPDEPAEAAPVEGE